MEGHAMDWVAPRALYVHVPFCRSKCAYCDFYSLPACEAEGSLVTAYVDGVLADLEAALRRFPPGSLPAYDTIYVGGGTPSVLPPRELSRLLAGIAARAGRPLEWTMEANPESLSEEVLDVAEGAGVNRLSLGIQSLDDGLLALLGRPARREACESALARAASRPGLRLSADLMAGLPRSTGLDAELASLLDAGLSHLSLYDLVLEEGSPLAAMVEEGRVLLPDEDEAWEERRKAEALLAKAGLAHYEVSNWAREGEESLHNLAYWHLDSYVGLGPAAVSTLRAADPSAPAGERGQSLRIEEGRDLALFASRPRPAIGRPAPDEAAPGRELVLLGARDSFTECLMMAMRTAFGIEPDCVEERFGLGLEALVGPSLASWTGHLGPGRPWPLPSRRPPRPEGEVARASLALDSSGLDLLNRFLVDCLADIEVSFPSPIPGPPREP